MATRGKIGVHVIRAAHEKGISVFSTIDQDVLHVRQADKAAFIEEEPE